MTHQEFKPPALLGAPAARAQDLALDIASKDYGVADIQTDRREGSKPTVRYNNQPATPSSWGSQQGVLEAAVAAGRETRLRYGSGLEVLQTALKNGTQRDLIADSRRRSVRVW